MEPHPPLHEAPTHEPHVSAPHPLPHPATPHHDTRVDAVISRIFVASFILYLISFFGSLILDARHPFGTAFVPVLCLWAFIYLSPFLYKSGLLPHPPEEHHAHH